MRNLKWNGSATTVMMLSTLVGCDAIDKLKDAIDGEPQTSYCESLCDWAVECADGESSMTRDEMI